MQWGYPSCFHPLDPLTERYTVQCPDTAPGIAGGGQTISDDVDYVDLGTDDVEACDDCPLTVELGIDFSGAGLGSGAVSIEIGCP